MSHVSRNTRSSVIRVNGYGFDDWRQIAGKDRDISLPFPVQTKTSAVYANSYLIDRFCSICGSVATGVPPMRIRGVIG
jgi:hypothetical protein